MSFRRSCLARLLISISLGGVSTVAIAWAAAAFASTTAGSQESGLIREGGITTQFSTRTSRFLTLVYWQSFEEELLPGVRDLVGGSWSQLPRWASAHRAADDLSKGPLNPGSIPERYEIATGWPLRAMAASFRATPDARGQRIDWTPKSGIAFERPAPLQGNPPATLPLRVLPLGFALDILIFAAAWCLVLFALPTTRRFLRWRRGACLKCGYGPLPSPDGRCSECGSIRGVRANATSSV